MIRLAGAGQPAPAGLPEQLPPGGAVTGAGIVTRIDEGLQQQGLEPPVIEPVRASAASELAEHLAGQMRHPDVGKNQEAAVVENPRHVLAACLDRLADPAVAHGHRAGRASQ